ncbi:VWA domain-containing protein [Candidatus Poribacteria bacterium]|nr:VWA domain-containing protein [Candidatus Poribacteria bacterium]
MNWRELQFALSRTQPRTVRVRLRPDRPWYHSTTFHAGVFSSALHIGLVLMLSASAINWSQPIEARRKPLFDGAIQVAFVSPRDVRRAARQEAPAAPKPVAAKKEAPAPKPRVKKPVATPKPKPTKAPTAKPAPLPARELPKPVAFEAPPRVATAAQVRPSPTDALPALQRVVPDLPEPTSATVAFVSELSPQPSRAVEAPPQPSNESGGSPNGTGEIAYAAPANDGTPSGQRRAQIGKALKGIAEAVADGSGPHAVDIVFLLDSSGSMDNNIHAVADNLAAMMDYLQRKGYDATFGVVKFKVSTIRIFPQSRDAARLKRLLESFQVGGDERALDAIDKAVKKVRFRNNVERRLVLVTDEPLTGASTLDATIGLARQSGIVVDVIGLGTEQHRSLARRTGGEWYGIPGED